MKYFLVALTLVVVLGCLFAWNGIYRPVSDSAETITFLIKKGESVKEISSNLEKQGLIRQDFLFRAYALIKGKHRVLNAGEYSLSKSMNIPGILEKFVKGEVVKKEITIIEGWNLRDIGWYFENEGMFMAEELFELVGFPATDYPNMAELRDFSQEFSFLEDKPKNVSLEGYLFPDTYEISPGVSLEEIIKELMVNFGKKLTLDLRNEIASQGKSVFEIITMASLIEKEVKTLEDKKIVSGILWKRLENKIPLQADAAIVYITGKKSTKVSTSETKIDSPYNTYKYRGLPLGPISNPGEESILAAVYPQDSPYFYYLSTPEGETIFSQTLEEHNIAKAQYLK